MTTMEFLLAALVILQALLLLELAKDENAWESELAAAVRHAITEPSDVITKAFPQKGE